MVKQFTELLRWKGKTKHYRKNRGSLISNAVTDNDDLMIINKSGLTIRMYWPGSNGKNNSGVRLINLKGSDSNAAVTKSNEDDEEKEIEVDEENIISLSAIEKKKSNPF
jgi:DNA gyrase subunit A